MKNNNKLLIIIILIITISFKFLPLNLKIAFGVFMFTSLIIYAFSIDESMEVKIILILGAILGFMYILNLLSSNVVLKDIIPIICAILLIGIIIAPKFVNSKHKSWKRKDIIAVVILNIILIILILDMIFA